MGRGRGVGFGQLGNLNLAGSMPLNDWHSPVQKLHSGCQIEDTQNIALQQKSTSLTPVTA